MKYILDASSLITAMNHRYPPSVFSSLWGKLDEEMKSGLIVSSSIVLDELTKGSDQLVKWAKDRRQYFEKPKNVEYEQVTRILDKYPKLIDTVLGTESADPYIIAKVYSMDTGTGCVVSEENKNKPFKIPSVAHAEGVRCISFLEMMKELDWIF